MTSTEEIQPFCRECSNTVIVTDRYCNQCGAYLRAEEETINIFNNTYLRYVFYFYFLYLFICLLIKYTHAFPSYQELFWVELVLAAITLVFVWGNWSEMKTLLIFNNFKWHTLLLVVGLGIISSSLVNYAVMELNTSFFHSEVNYYKVFKRYSFPTAMMIYSIALLPAIFEELTFRGVMYNYCRKFLDEKLVVIVTAFLFAMMHLSFISLIWLIPFGIYLGHLRKKYNTIWYGIVFHFIFNLVACGFDLFQHSNPH